MSSRTDIAQHADSVPILSYVYQVEKNTYGPEHYVDLAPVEAFDQSIEFTNRAFVALAARLSQFEYVLDQLGLRYAFLLLQNLIETFA